MMIMNKKMMWEIINFLIILGYTIISILSGMTISILIMHIFTNVSPIDSSLIPFLFVGSLGISFFVMHRTWKFFNWFYFDTKSKILWLNNLSIREKMIDIRTIKPLNPEDDWINNEKGQKL